MRETAAGQVRWQKWTRFLLGQSFTGRVRRKTKRALDRVTFSVSQGEVIGVLGPNGAGKTTLFEILGTALIPDEGRVEIMGYDVMGQRKMAASYVTPVFPMLAPEDMWTARQNLEYMALLYNVPAREMISRINDIVKLLDLESRADEIVRKYSSGMIAKLTLGMGLMIDRPIYLFDEPFIGIDPPTSRDIKSFIEQELIRKGKTVLLASHVMGDIEQLCRRILFLNDGKLIADDMKWHLKKAVRGREIIDLEVLCDGTAEEVIIRKVRQCADVVEGLVAVDSNHENSCHKFTIFCDNARDLLPGIVSLVVGCQGQLRFAKVSEATLEDVFIQLTGRKLSDDSIEGNEKD